MKKIGFVNFDMSVRGGAQQVLYNMALALRKDYEIMIISFIQEKESCAYDLPKDIRYEVILPYKARIREVITKAGKPFRTLIKENGLDLVFYIGAYAGLCGGIHGRRLKIPRVFCDHGALLNQWKEIPARIMRTLGSHFTDKTVVLTKQSEDAYYNKFHYKKGRVITIYNWIDERIQKAAMPYDEKNSKILTAGRFSKEKGMDLLVDTAAALSKKTKDFVWEVYGDGDMFAEIKERIQREGLEENVLLMGLTDEMESCYQGHSMYVLTSYREGLPLVLIEAKANALPLVSFDIISGPREIIRDGEDGKLISPYDTEKMAEVIFDLLKKPEERLRLSKNSQSNLENFSKETILSQWKELIEQFVGSSR
ncbi:MAG: glycosyltransferase [Eubacterium sp.]